MTRNHISLKIKRTVYYHTRQTFVNERRKRQEKFDFYEPFKSFSRVCKCAKPFHPLRTNPPTSVTTKLLCCSEKTFKGTSKIQLHLNFDRHSYNCKQYHYKTTQPACFASSFRDQNWLKLSPFRTFWNAAKVQICFSWEFY